MSADITEKKPKKTAAKKTKGDKVKASTAPAKAKKTAAAKTVVTIVGEAATPQTNRTPSYESVAALAHRFFEERHCQHGFHEQDWFRAEQELSNAS